MPQSQQKVGMTQVTPRSAPCLSDRSMGPGGRSSISARHRNVHLLTDADYREPEWRTEATATGGNRFTPERTTTARRNHERDGTVDEPVA